MMSVMVLRGIGMSAQVVTRGMNSVWSIRTRGMERQKYVYTHRWL